MPTPLSPRRRGRPPRHPIDGLRTRLWFHVVKLRSGLTSSYAIEIALEPDRFRQSSDGIKRPSKWAGYESGSRVPRALPRRPDAIEVAEAAYPGSAAYFHSPLWRALKGQVQDVPTVEGLLLSLASDVVNVLVREIVHGGVVHKQFVDFGEQSIAELVTIGSFDALAAALLLVRKSELIGYPLLREGALDCYLQLQPRLAALPEVQPFAVELFRLIDTTCKHWVFPTTQSRLEVVIFSEQLQALRTEASAGKRRPRRRLPD